MAPMSQNLLWRRVLGCPLFVAAGVYGIVTVSEEYGLQSAITPALVASVCLSPVTAWLIVRSERAGARDKKSDGRRTVVAVTVVVLGALLLRRVVVGLLALMVMGVALFTGLFLAAVWELWRGTYRGLSEPPGRQSPAP